jgi:ppGpp synthetase/RelA/SpoT-type nucleotidyltranferase
MKFSRTQVDKIGESLRKISPARESDLMKLLEWRSQFVGVLAYSVGGVEKLTNMNEVVSGGIKNGNTIIDKIRMKSTRLSQMIDVAGVRVVMDDSNLLRQDLLVESISKLDIFEDVSVDDIRADGRFGYRAVHIHAKMNTRFVEAFRYCLAGSLNL